MVLTPNTASARQCREGHLPADPLRVRLIRVELESGEVEVLITSLLDTKAYPYRAFAKLYALRWGIELFELPCQGTASLLCACAIDDFHSEVKALRGGWLLRISHCQGL